MYLEEAAALSG